MKLLLSLLLSSFVLFSLHHSVFAQPQQCQNVTTQPGFDLESYISGRWYSQQQRPSPFQPETLNFCTTADYTKIDGITNIAPPGYNEAYTIQVFNTAQDANGTVFTSNDEAQVGPDPGPLCGLEQFPNGTDPAKLLVGNCFVDPSNPFASGPYWVVAYNETDGYALISGGQPDVPTSNGLCTFSSPFNGLWIFTRDSERDEDVIEAMIDVAIANGIDPSSMLPVDQEDCTYPEVPTMTPTTTPPITETPSSFMTSMPMAMPTPTTATPATPEPSVAPPTMAPPPPSSMPTSGSSSYISIMNLGVQLTATATAVGVMMMMMMM